MRSNAADRNADLARIHCLMKDLGLSDDEYRDVLFTLERVRSAADLDWAGRRRVIDHFAARLPVWGRQPRPRRGAGEWAFVERQPVHTHKQWRYLIVLCREAGVGRGGQKAYVEGIARHMHGLGQNIEAPAELWSGADLANVVNAMVFRVRQLKRKAAP